MHATAVTASESMPTSRRLPAANDDWNLATGNDGNARNGIWLTTRHDGMPISQLSMHTLASCYSWCVHSLLGP